MPIRSLATVRRKVDRIDVAAKDAAATPLRVVTANLWAHYLVYAPARLERVRSFCNFVAATQPTVVCVQEVFLLRCVCPGLLRPALAMFTIYTTTVSCLGFEMMCCWN